MEQPKVPIAMPSRSTVKVTPVSSPPSFKKTLRRWRLTPSTRRHSRQNETEDIDGQEDNDAQTIADAQTASHSAEQPVVGKPAGTEEQSIAAAQRATASQTPPAAQTLTAIGFIQTAASGTKFTSSFLIDDILYSFAGNIAPSVQEFRSSEAVLEYADLAQLTSTRGITGRVGIKILVFNLANGAKITGELDAPVQPASTICGNGIWTQA